MEWFKWYRSRNEKYELCEPNKFGKLDIFVFQIKKGAGLILILISIKVTTINNALNEAKLNLALIFAAKQKQFDKIKYLVDLGVIQKI